MGKFFFEFLLVLDHSLVKGAVGDAFGEDDLINVEFLFDVFIFIRLLESWQEVTLHQGFVLAGDFLGSDAVDTVGIVSDSDEEGGEEDGHVEAVSLLPPSHVGRTGDALGEFIRGVKFLILDELAEPLGALFVVVKLQKSELGGPDGGADELVDFALIFGEEEEFPVFADVLLELLLELDDMFEHQFLLGSIFLVGDGGSLLVLEVSATLVLLVDHHLPPLEELLQLLVCLALHLKII